MFPQDRFLNTQFAMTLSLLTFFACTVADDEALSTHASVIDTFSVRDSVTGSATLDTAATILAHSITRHFCNGYT